MNLRSVVIAVSLAVSATAVGQQSSVQLYAAGSLRAPMIEIVQAFTASGGPEVHATFGASGLLRERIEKGEPADVFASADLGNPQALVQAGRATAPVIFARNRLCALVAPDVAANSDTLLDRMLDSQVKLGTSTPKADPSGDYAWQSFEKAEQLRPGAFKALDAKALKLTGGPNSPPPPADHSIYGVMIAEHKADIFLTYCTNALQAVREVPGAQMIALPEALAVGADYGLTTMKSARPGAERLAEFILSPQAQGILARHGFAPGRTR
jgi:ABC-type molybdate transport system substrate-binding protein